MSFKIASTPSSNLRLTVELAVIAIVGAVMIFIVIPKLRGGDAARSSSIAAQSGANSCSSSGYQLVSPVDASQKTTIYNCYFGSELKCVTQTGGVASDETAMVRLLFTNVAGSAKPNCLNGSI